MIVVFDMFGVVVDWGSKYVVPEWAKLLQVTENEFRQKSKEALHLCESGKITMEQLWKRLAITFDGNATELRDTFLNAFHEHAKIVDDIVPVIVSCPERVLLSNQFPLHADEAGQNGWFSYFDEVFLSFEIGHRKPSKEAYEYVIKELGKKPEELILVDDKQENVDAAKAVGMKAVLFEDVGQLKKELEKLLSDAS